MLPILLGTGLFYLLIVGICVIVGKGIQKLQGPPHLFKYGLVVLILGIIKDATFPLVCAEIIFISNAIWYFRHKRKQKATTSATTDGIELSQ